MGLVPALEPPASNATVSGALPEVGVAVSSAVGPDPGVVAALTPKRISSFEGGCAPTWRVPSRSLKFGMSGTLIVPRLLAASLKSPVPKVGLLGSVAGIPAGYRPPLAGSAFRNVGALLGSPRVGFPHPLTSAFGPAL